MRVFHVVLLSDSVVFDTGFGEKIGGGCLLHRFIALLFFVSQDFIEGREMPALITQLLKTQALIDLYKLGSSYRLIVHRLWLW